MTSPDTFAATTPSVPFQTVDLIDRIDARLPQTQCRQCGFDGCRPYARAIADGIADINQCPPGGAAGIAALAELLGVATKPLNPAHGIEQPRQLAVIDETRCIGCTLCIQACPVDAIVGAAKLMHTVLADECSGCRLCLPPCPVDCIEMVPSHDEALPTAMTPLAERWRRRHTARQSRLAHEAREKLERATLQKQALLRPGTDAIARAVERAKARKQTLGTNVNAEAAQRQPGGTDE